MKTKIVIVCALIALVVAQEDGRFDVTTGIPSMQPNTAELNMDSLLETASEIDMAGIEDAMSKLPPQLKAMVLRAGISQEDILEAAHNMSPQMIQMAASMSGVSMDDELTILNEEDEVVEDPEEKPEEEVVEESEEKTEEEVVEEAEENIFKFDDLEVLIPEMTETAADETTEIDDDTESPSEEILSEIENKEENATYEVVDGDFEASQRELQYTDDVDVEGDTETMEQQENEKIIPDIDVEIPESVIELKEQLMSKMSDFGLNADMSSPDSMKEMIMSKLQNMGIPVGNSEGMEGFLKNSMHHMMQSFMMQIAAQKMMAAPSTPQMLPPPPMREMGMPHQPMREMIIPRTPMREMGMPRPQMSMPRRPILEQRISQSMGAQRFPSVELPPINLEINVNIDSSDFNTPTPLVFPHSPSSDSMSSFLMGDSEVTQSGVSRGAVDGDAMKLLIGDLPDLRMVERELMEKKSKLSAQMESLAAGGIPEMAEFGVPSMRMPMMAQLLTVTGISGEGFGEMPAGGIIGKLMERMSGRDDSSDAQSPLMTALMGAMQ